MDLRTQGIVERRGGSGDPRRVDCRPSRSVVQSLRVRSLLTWNGDGHSAVVVEFPWVGPLHDCSSHWRTHHSGTADRDRPSQGRRVLVPTSIGGNTNPRRCASIASLGAPTRMAEAELDALPDAEEPQPDTAQLSGPDQPNGELPQQGTCKTAVGRSRAHHMSVFRDLASALPDLLFLSGDKRQGRRRSPRTKPGRAGGPTAWLGGRAAAAATGLFTDVIVVSRRRETTHQVPAGTEDIIADVASGPTLTARGQGTATASRALQRGLRMHSTTPTHGGRPCCLPPLRWGTVASLTATRSLTATGTDHRCDDPYDLADRHMTDPPVFASEKFKTDWK